MVPVYPLTSQCRLGRADINAIDQGPVTFSRCRPEQPISSTVQARYIQRYVSSWDGGRGMAGRVSCIHARARELGAALVPMPLLPAPHSQLGCKHSFQPGGSCARPGQLGTEPTLLLLLLTSHPLPGWSMGSLPGWVEAVPALQLRSRGQKEAKAMCVQLLAAQPQCSFSLPQV